jgi:hypothetical protein
MKSGRFLDSRSEIDQSLITSIPAEQNFSPARIIGELTTPSEAASPGIQETARRTKSIGDVKYIPLGLSPDKSHLF